VRNSHEVLQMQNYANTYEYLNSQCTCKSHLMRISTQNLHRQKIQTLLRIKVKTYIQIFPNN
jgi:hypothetical protein